MDEHEELREKLARLQEAADFKWLCGDPRGRRLLWRLLKRLKVFEPVFNPDKAVMGFNEGQRNAGLFLLSEINQHSPAQYAVMVEENTASEASDE